MPKARPYRIPGGTGALSQILHGAAKSAPDVLKEIFKLKIPMTDKDAADIAYKKYLMSEGPAQRKHALELFKLKREQEEAIDVRELGQEKELIALKGGTGQQKIEEDVRKQQMAVTLEQIKSGLGTREKKKLTELEHKLGQEAALAQWDREAPGREAETILARQQAMTSGAMADNYRSMAKMRQMDFDLRKGEFVWDKAMDIVDIQADYAWKNFDAESAYEVEKFRGLVKLLAAKEASGITVADFAKNELSQTNFMLYQYFKSRAEEDKPGMQAALDGLAHHQKQLKDYVDQAPQFDFDYKPGKPEWRDGAFQRFQHTPGEPAELTPRSTAPSAQQQPGLPPLNIPTVPKPLGFLTPGKRRSGDDVQGAIGELRGVISVPLSPQAWSTLLEEGFSPQQIEEIENALSGR